MSTPEADESRRVTLETVELLSRQVQGVAADALAAATGGATSALQQLTVLSHMLHVASPAALKQLLHGRSVAIPVPDGQVFVDLGDWTSYVMLEQSSWEHHLLPVCRDVISPGDTVLDVGAHTGSYVACFAAAVGNAGKVVAFEPVPDNLELLTKTIAINDIADTVTIAAIALSNTAGNALLFPYDRAAAGTQRYPGESSMLYSLLPGDGYGTEGISVPVTTLDDYAEQNDLASVTFIKIDTEGAEGRILEGASRLIERSAGISILVELHPVELAAEQRTTSDVVALLHQYSLSVWDLRGDRTRQSRHRLGRGETPVGRHILARKLTA